MADDNKSSFTVGDEPVDVRSGNVLRGHSWSHGPDDGDDHESNPLNVDSGETRSVCISLFFFFFFLCVYDTSPLIIDIVIFINFFFSLFV